MNVYSLLVSSAQLPDLATCGSGESHGLVTMERCFCVSPGFRTFNLMEYHLVPGRCGAETEAPESPSLSGLL